MKTVIYHSADFDGIFCREIAKHFLACRSCGGKGYLPVSVPEGMGVAQETCDTCSGKETVEFIGWNFGDDYIPFPKEGLVYVLDLPLDCLSHQYSMERCVWIDHHKTAIDKWTDDIPGYRIDGVAACRLVWAWFQSCQQAGRDRAYDLPTKEQFINRQVQEPLAVRLAGEYDAWDHRGDGDIAFQFGLDSEPVIEWDYLLGEDDTGTYVSDLVKDGEIAMRCYAKREADIMRGRSFKTRWEGLTFLCLNTAKCNSLTFAERDVPETGHDALMAFYFNGEAWIMSLYHAQHRTDIDLSQIAVRHGGGGHKGACGFTIKLLPFLT